jgi:hypothetical protein
LMDWASRYKKLLLLRGLNRRNTGVEPRFVINLGSTPF